MKRRIVPILIVLLMLVGANAHAATINVGELGISFTVPDTQYSSSQEVDVLSLEGNDLLGWKRGAEEELNIISSALGTRAVGACQYNVQKPFNAAYGLNALMGYSYSGSSYPFMYVSIEAFEKPDGFDMPDEFMEKIKIAETTENKQTTSQGELYSLETVINSKGERYYELLEKEEALKYTWHIAGRYMLFEDLMLVVGVCEIEREDAATTIATAQAELNQVCDSLKVYFGKSESRKTEVFDGKWLLTTEMGDRAILEIEDRIYQIETLDKQGRGFISEENGGFVFSSDERSIADGCYYITESDMQLVSDDGTKTLNYLWNSQEQ